MERGRELEQAGRVLPQPDHIRIVRLADCWGTGDTPKAWLAHHSIQLAFIIAGLALVGVAALLVACRRETTLSRPCIHKLSVYRGARWGHRAYSLGTFRYRPRAPTRRWFRSNRQLRDTPLSRGCMTKKLGNAIPGCFLSESHYVTSYL